MKGKGIPALRDSIASIDGNSDQCLEWVWGKQKGYGTVRIGNKMHRVHRLAYEMTIGPIPSGRLVCHRCDNPACYRPSHLFLGSHSDNMRDCISKGRSRKGLPQVSTLGERNPNAKLNEGLVRDILKMYQSGLSQREIARRLQFSQSAVQRVATRKTWKHVAQEVA